MATNAKETLLARDLILQRFIGCILAQQKEKYISKSDNEQSLKKFPLQEKQQIMVFGN